LARIDRDQFLDLWQQIRDLGLCVPGRMPGGIDRYSDYVLPILAELQYLSPIQQSLNDDNFSGASQGLLLNPLSGNRPPTQYHTLTQPRQLALLTQDANPNQD
jgi:hypothetical protein